MPVAQDDPKQAMTAIGHPQIDVWATVQRTADGEPIPLPPQEEIEEK